MKRIWIRNQISNHIKIILGILFIILILFLWIMATTIRSPLKKINKDDFELKILNSIYTDEDKLFLKQYYNIDMKNEIYFLKTKLSNKEKIQIFDLIKSSKYAYQNDLHNPVMSLNVLPHPLDILKSFPNLILGISEDSTKFDFQKSLFYAIWISLRRELIAFLIVIIVAIPLGIMMSCNNYLRSFIYPLLVIGSFIPIAALIPLTMAFFGIGEEQKIIFLALGMFFVLLGLVIKEIDEVDNIYLNTAYTLGFGQFKTIMFVLFPTAMPRIWKHFSSVFGLGWGYIIFAEMINSGGGDAINGIGWLFIARQRRFKVPEMYAIFIVIIIFAFIFSYLFKLVSYMIFKHERDLRND